jgi:hypothetical protein
MTGRRGIRSVDFTPVTEENAMKSTQSTARPRRALARVTCAAAGAATLAGSLLAAAPPAGAAVLNTACPVVWNGSVLVTAAISATGQLVAYEQVLGATSWAKFPVATHAPDGEPLVTVSMAATANTVQIAAEDDAGSIWFYQQSDSTGVWSKGQLVGSVSQGNAGGLQTPQIAWTGVPRHAGTNSVVTVADGSGNLLMWYQNGGGWSQETVSDGTSSDEFDDAVVTATDRGIVIVSLRTDGGFYSFFQPYGANPWVSDGTIDVGPDQSFDSVAVTWDGTNVDVDAAYNSGTGLPNPDELLFAWKPDTAGWSKKDILGPNSAKPLDYTPAITFTGSNLLLTTDQAVSSTQERLDFWWQGSAITNFNFESVATANGANGYGPPRIAYTEGASAPEAVIVAPFTTNNFETSGLNDWTEPFASSIWTKHVVTPA